MSARRLRTVGFNAVFLKPEESGGTESYLRGLVPALAAERPDLRLVVFTSWRGSVALRKDGWGDFADVVAVPTETGPPGYRLLSELVRTPRLAARMHCDVLHSLANTGPIHSPVPSVLTVLDVTYLTTTTLGLVRTAAFRTIVPLSVRQAAALIAISAAARDEIARALGVPPAAFTVTPLAPSRRGSEPAPENDVRARLALGDRRVVLCLAATRAHKNHALLLDALPGLDRDVVLVLAGPRGAADLELRARVEHAGVANRVCFAGYVPSAELEALWRLATCLVLPTRAEGFCLPLVEALSRGVPVACSDIPVLREVGGDVPHYFDPRDATRAAEAIRAAAADRRAASAGPDRARLFSWRATAEGTLEAYERAAASRRR